MATTPKEVLSGKCPLCKKEFSTCFCPNCGTPLSTNNNMRPEYKSFNEFQLCDKCHTKNPYGAKYCRNCGEDITLHAKDKYGHGWIDLGLSVLWSTENIWRYYLWNYPEKNYYLKDDFSLEDYSEYRKSEKKDVATYNWGKKWRTPTKEEFEELINNCKWEKCLVAKQYALKAIGPNGNSIILPTDNGECCLWTSSNYDNNERAAYCFFFKDWFERLYSIVDGCTLGLYNKSNEEKNKYWNHVQRGLNEAFEFIKQMKKNKDVKTSLLSEIPFVSNLKEIEDIVTRTTKWNNLIEKQTKEWKWDLFHFSWQEKERLWLETPIKISCDENSFFRNITRRVKQSPLGVRPVADKKWQGKL